MSGVPLPSTTLSPADTRKVQHVAVHAARATCMLKAEALLTSPQAGRPPGQSGHQRLFWLQLCTGGLLFALQLHQREILFPAANDHPGLQQLVQTLEDQSIHQHLVPGCIFYHFAESLFCFI